MAPTQITEREGKILSWIALLVGVLLTITGLFGVWVQGLFYRGGFPTPATFGEVRMAFTLPAAVTTLGSLIVTCVVFASSIALTWSPRQKLTVVVCYGVIVLLGCGVAGHLATTRIASMLN